MTKQIYSARQAIENKIELPYGIQIIPAKSYQDKRGTFSEIFRNNQSLDLPSPVQWNIVSSEKMF